MKGLIDKTQRETLRGTGQRERRRKRKKKEARKEREERENPGGEAKGSWIVRLLTARAGFMKQLLGVTFKNQGGNIYTKSK